MSPHDCAGKGVFVSALNIITSFTIAHSITLAVATLQLVQIPSRIVEPLIAASIIFVGAENLLRGDIPKARRMVPFGFGAVSCLANIASPRMMRFIGLRLPIQRVPKK